MNDTIAIPERLKSRPVWRGFVVPYTVAVDTEGKVDFRVTDMDHWYRCVKEKLCSICGEPLDYWVWYVGGGSCNDSGVYFDLAMHEECCFYSASVCPFLMGGREYSNHAITLAGYQKEVVRQDVAKASVLYAAKRRRDQLRIAYQGGGPVVHTGPAVESIRIWPKEDA